VVLRKRYLLLACMLGIALAVAPAIASSETGPAIEAANSSAGIYSSETHAWAPTQVTVSEGGVVTLSNPTEVPHGVEWRGGPETPTCASGVPVGNSPTASGRKWTGTCRFSKPGIYTFYCTVHGPEMTGTVTVSANGTTTTSMTMPTAPAPTPTTPAGETGSETPSGSPLAGSASTAIKLPHSQHGRSVEGSLELSQAGSGGRLEVALYATRASLAGAGNRTRVRVGRLSRPSLKAGLVSFTVPLTARARSALRHHRRLALTVQIVLTPTHGAAVKVTRAVVEQA
jgi:plastocyanin